MPKIACFASHDWGTAGTNHSKVREVVQKLRQRGIDVWFDENHMKNNILDAMCSGIDTCDVCLVFVTSNYVSKVKSKDDTDNVRREFLYAKDTPDKLLPIKFDASLPKKWEGPVGMILGSRLYVDMVQVNEATVDNLVREIRKVNNKTMWKSASTMAANMAKATPPRKQPRPSTRPVTTNGLKQRANDLCLAFYGRAMRPEEHTAAVLDNMLVSVGKVQDPPLPLVDQVRVLEREILAK